MGLGNILSLGLVGALTSPKKKKSQTDLLLEKLNPIINEQNWIGKHQFEQGEGDIGRARENYDYLLNHFKSILEGDDPNQLLDLIDTTDLDDNYEQMERVGSELIPRGGQRASVLGNLDFEKSKELRGMINAVRQKSPEAIKSLADALAQLGLGEYQASSGNYGQGINSIFGLLELEQRKKDRKAQMIGSIIESAGAIAGAFACVVPSTLVFTKDGKFTIKSIIEKNLHLKVYDFNSKSFVPIIGHRITPGQPVIKIATRLGYELSCTKSHFVKISLDDTIGVEVAKLKPTHPIVVSDGANEIVDRVLYIENRHRRSEVITLKLDSWNENFAFSANGIVSFDDDLKD